MFVTAIEATTLVVVRAAALVGRVDTGRDLLAGGQVVGEDPGAVHAEAGAVGEQLPEGDRLDVGSAFPVRWEEGPMAVSTPRPRSAGVLSTTTIEHLPDAGGVRHDVRSHRQAGRIGVCAGGAGGDDRVVADQRDVADDLPVEWRTRPAKTVGDRHMVRVTRDAAGRDTLVKVDV